jgi:hypothetical protein
VLCACGLCLFCLIFKLTQNSLVLRVFCFMFFSLGWYGFLCLSFKITTSGPL